MANYWYLTYAELQKLAVERPSAYAAGAGERAGVGDVSHIGAIDLHPALTEVLRYCRARAVYPLAFLDHYETEARRTLEDRPRDVWMADLRVKFWEWQKQPSGRFPR